MWQSTLLSATLVALYLVESRTKQTWNERGNFSGEALLAGRVHVLLTSERAGGSAGLHGGSGPGRGVGVVA